MKKLTSIALIVTAFVLAFTACGSYKPDTSGFTKEYIQKEQAFLDEFKGKYESATTDADKEKYAFEVGFRNMNLGNYEDAIDYYEIVLEYNPGHTQTLNNLAVIYEEMGDIEKALGYEQQIYNANTTNVEIIRDTIRLLVKNGQFSNANGVLDTFAITEESKNQAEFLSEQKQYLVDEEAKAKK